MSFWFISFLTLMLINVVLSLDTELVLCYFTLDKIGAYLTLICLFFYLVFIYFFQFYTKVLETFCMSVSMLSAIICFNTNKVMIFWVAYELSIIFALALIYYSSPYSERFLASWYLLCYMLVFGLPLLLIFFYLSLSNKSFKFSLWTETSMEFIMIMLLVFSSKVPLPPFNAWLPIVHAEASSLVSIILSGYMMKLGMVGIFRFCSTWLLNLWAYELYIMSFSLIFFLIALQELDTKRWLAFLSLSHIIIGMLGLFLLKKMDYFLVSTYCLSHGMSAFLMFYLFMLLSDTSKTRNWLVLAKDKNMSIFSRVIMVMSLLSVASFPPTMNFLAEIYILSVVNTSILKILFFSFYLFLGGMVPLLVISHILMKSKVINPLKKFANLSWSIMMLVLTFYCFLLFILL